MIHKSVGVELRSVIDREDDREMSIIKQSGEYMSKDDVEVIKFTEEREDIGTINHVIMITPNKVTIRRSGSVRLVQTFEIGKKHVSIYRNPFGSLEIEIETKRLVHRPLTERKHGEVMIQYTSLINEVEKQHHLITLTYMEEKQK